MCSDRISCSFMFSIRKQSLSTILDVCVQIVPILCNLCCLFYLFPTTFRLFTFPICFPPFALNQISTQFSSSVVQFVQCYVILLFAPGFSGVRVIRSIVLFLCFENSCLSFCSFFFWPLCCLSFFELRILIIPLKSSSSSYCLVQVTVVNIFYLFSLEISLTLTTVKTINPLSQ